MSARIWRYQCSDALLVGVYSGTFHCSKRQCDTSSKRWTWNDRVLLTEFYSCFSRNKNIGPHKNLYANVHSSIFIMTKKVGTADVNQLGSWLGSLVFLDFMFCFVYCLITITLFCWSTFCVNFSERMYERENYDPRVSENVFFPHLHTHNWWID